MKNVLWSAAVIASLTGLYAAFAPPGSTPQTTPASTAKNSAPAPAAVSAAPTTPATSGAAVMQIFAERCATRKCHGGEKPKEQLDLSTAARIKATAIGVNAEEQAALKRILPGNPEESYLFLKITKRRRNDSRIKWKPMPPDAAQALDDKQIALIEAWIKSGAAVD